MTSAGGTPGRTAAGRAWSARHRRPLLLAGAVGAAGLSVLWFRVLPDAAGAAGGWQGMALRYGHGVCWALLSAALVTGAVDGPPRLRGALAWAALGSYAVFLLAVLTT